MTLQRQIPRFLGVGGVATAAHFAVALAVNAMLDPGPLLANCCGFAIAVLISYAGHTRLTFGIYVRRAVHFPRFLLVSVSGLALSSFIAWYSVEKLGMPFALAMLAIAALVPILTFLALKLWALKG